MGARILSRRPVPGAFSFPRRRFFFLFSSPLSRPPNSDQATASAPLADSPYPRGGTSLTQGSVSESSGFPLGTEPGEVHNHALRRAGVFPASPAPRGPRPSAFCARADADLLLGRCHGARRGLQRPELSPGAGVAGHLCPDTCWGRGGEGEREETSCCWSQREFLGGLEHEPLEPPPPSVTEPRQGVRGHSPLRSGPKCQGVGVRQEQPLASEGAAWTVYGRFTDAQHLHPSGRWRGVLGPSARAQADSGLRGPGGSSHPSRPLPGASAFAGDVYRAPLCARLCEGLAVYLTGSLQQGRKAAGVTALRRGH